MISIYEHRDYKDYLRKRSVEHGKRSGFKSGLAKACGCNNAYVSSIISGYAHLSLEQAERACSYLDFDLDESHYFLLMVQRARAGTSSLASYFDRHLDRMLEQKLNVQDRLGARERLSKLEQARYYSSWIYPAVHVALSVPRFSLAGVEPLAQYFDLPVPVVKEAVDFLLDCGLAERDPKDGTLNIGPRHIHLAQNSENIQRHHTNWRLQALRSFERKTEDALHYSSAVTLAREDAYRVREILLKAIQTSADLILRSPEQEVFVLSLDFFQLGRKGC